MRNFKQELREQEIEILIKIWKITTQIEFPFSNWKCAWPEGKQEARLTPGFYAIEKKNHIEPTVLLIELSWLIQRRQSQLSYTAIGIKLM